MRAINFFILFLLVEAFQLFSFLQAQNINASVDRNSILIGEQIKLVVTADNVDVKKYPIVQWPQIPDSFNHFEVIERSKIDTVSKNGVNHYEQTYILTSLDEGFWDIPAFNLSFSKKSSRNPVSLPTTSIKIKVFPADISRLKNYHDIKNIMQTPKESDHSQTKTNSIIALIAVIVLVIVLWAVLKRRRIKSKTLEKKGMLNSIDWILEQLTLLEKKKIPDKDAVKEYYHQLYQLCRQYFSIEFDINVLYCTTEEWVGILEGLELDKKNKAAFYELVKKADSVRFADRDIAEKQNEEISTARNFVKALHRLKTGKS
ncbi:MAG TPA: BatD family protein [Chitinophagaceae bacterium]|nr:BatD family protein [Chitinophagaceae bacterium]